MKVIFYLDDDLALSLRYLVEIEGRSQDELIRDALMTLISQRICLIPTGTSEFHSGYSGVLERPLHNDALASSLGGMAKSHRGVSPDASASACPHQSVLG